MDTTLLYNLSRMHYEENLGQQEIANRTGISRPQVSRMLKEARARRIVTIEVIRPYVVEEGKLSKRLKKLLGARDVRIVSSAQVHEDEHDKRMDHVTDYAAAFMIERVGQYRKVGVGWGRTVYSMVLKMPFSNRHTNLCFVPLVGSASMDNPAFQSNSIIDRIAEKFGADKQFINAPAFFTDKGLYDTFYQNTIEQIGPLWDEIDVAVFSLGAPIHDNPSLAKYTNNEELMEDIDRANPSGDLLGKYYDSRGQFIEDVNTYCVNIPEAKLRQIPLRVCIALGESKVKSIVAASNSGLFTDLITDSFTALKLIEALES